MKQQVEGMEATLVCSRWKDGPSHWREMNCSSSLGLPCCVLKAGRGTDRGSGEFDTHHSCEGDRHARPLQWRPKQVRRLVVQAQNVHGCSRDSTSAAVPRSRTVSSPDLERHSRSHPSHDQRTTVPRLGHVVNGHGVGPVTQRWNQRRTREVAPVHS